jgi:hypothetical protein
MVAVALAWCCSRPVAKPRWLSKPRLGASTGCMSTARLDPDCPPDSLRWYVGASPLGEFGGRNRRMGKRTDRGDFPVVVRFTIQIRTPEANL